MSEELVVVATTNDIIEAEFFRAQLEAEGFEVFMADENLIGANFFLANAIGGIKLKVREEDAEDAATFVEDLRNAEIIEDENFKTDTGWGECGMCESRDLEIDQNTVDSGKFSLFGFGIPTSTPKRRLICKNCGNAWAED